MLTRILRANLAESLQRDISFDVLGLGMLIDSGAATPPLICFLSYNDQCWCILGSDGRPQLALQLIRTLYRFIEAYENGRYTEVGVAKEALYACGRSMLETAVTILQTEFRPATAAMFLDLLFRNSSTATLSGVDSLLLTMFLADACSTSISDLEDYLFGEATLPTKYELYFPLGSHG